MIMIPSRLYIWTVFTVKLKRFRGLIFRGVLVGAFLGFLWGFWGVGVWCVYGFKGGFLY